MQDINTTEFINSKHIKSQLSVQLQADLKNGNIRYEDAGFHVKHDITGGTSTVTILDNDLAKAIGITNIDKGSLPTSVSLILKSLFIGHASGDNLKVIDAVTSSDLEGFPSALANAELEIFVGNAPIFKQRISDLATLKGANVDNSRDAFDLTNWRIIPDNQSFSIKITFPKTVSVPAVGDTKHIVEVALFGDKTVQR